MAEDETPSEREKRIEHEKRDELAREVERAIRRFDRALGRHEEARDRATSYADATPLWDRVEDTLHG